jgi:DNA-binding transcriptional LysR family regulator
MMEIRFLEDFVMLAELRSFSKAAIQRHSTQSAFSRRIQCLEAWMGVTLVDRRANPLGLTAAGDAFYVLAQDTLRSIKHGREEIASISSQTLSAISFAVSHTLSLHFFPRWIREVENDLGNLNLRLLALDGTHCRAALMNGDCHFMIAHFEARMAEDFRGTRFRSLCLGRDRLIPVSAPGAAQARIPGTASIRTPYLTYASGSFMGRCLDLFLNDTKEPPYLQPCFESSLAEGVKAMILAGHGVGWVPESLVRAELASGALVRAADSEWDIPFEVRLFRPITRLPKIAEKLWTLLLKQSPDSTTDFFEPSGGELPAWQAPYANSAFTKRKTS